MQVFSKSVCVGAGGFYINWDEIHFLLSFFYDTPPSLPSMSAQISSGQTYKITNVKSGTVVDLSGVDNHTGVSISCRFE